MGARSRDDAAHEGTLGELDRHPGDRHRLLHGRRGHQDRDGVGEIIESHPGARPDPAVTFIHGNYANDLGPAEQAFDLLMSLHAGFVSEHCLDNLRVGGHLPVQPSHGDAALASVNGRLQLTGVLLSTSAGYRYSSRGLDEYLIPNAGVEVTRELVFDRGRSIGYAKPAFAYVFERTS